MKKTLLLSFVALASTAFAGTNALKVNLFQDSVIGGKTLKAGEYRISVENGNATIKQGKETIEVPAREETASTKFSHTELTYKDANLEKIGVEGTHTTIIFGTPEPAHQGQ